MMIGVIEWVYIVLSLSTIPLALFNYAMTRDASINRYLHAQIRKFCVVLLATIVVISMKVIMGCTLLPGLLSTPYLLKEVMTLLLSILLFAYNVGLAYFLFNTLSKPVIDCKFTALLSNTVLLFLFFSYLSEYLTTELDKILNLTAFLFISILVYSLYRLKLYLNVLKDIVEPIDVQKPTMLFVIGSYLSATAVIISLHSLIVAKIMFMISIIYIGASMLLFDRRIRWIASIVRL